MKELEYNTLIYQIKFLNLKLKDLEEKDQKGRLDLNYRISESYRYVSPEQKNKFKNNFFGNQEIVSNDSLKNAAPESNDKIVETSKTRKIVSGWQKSLLKEIAKKTHPDVISHYPQSDKDLLIDVYLKSQEYYNDCKDADLLTIAEEVKVKPKKLTKEHEILLKTAVTSKTTKIDILSKSHYVIWETLEESKRKVFLENYLRQLGYEIKEEHLDVVIKSIRPERKVGTRPNKLSLRRRIKK